LYQDKKERLDSALHWFFGCDATFPFCSLDYSTRASPNTWNTSIPRVKTLGYLNLPLQGNFLELTQAPWNTRHQGVVRCWLFVVRGIEWNTDDTNNADFHCV